MQQNQASEGGNATPRAQPAERPQIKTPTNNIYIQSYENNNYNMYQGGANDSIAMNFIGGFQDHWCKIDKLANFR